MQEQPNQTPEQSGASPGGQPGSAPYGTGGPPYSPPNPVGSPYVYPPSGRPPVTNGFVNSPPYLYFAENEEKSIETDPVEMGIRVAGQPMDWRQFAGLHYGRGQTTKWLVAALCALFALMGYEAVGIASYNQLLPEYQMTQIVLLLALIMAVLGGNLWRNRRRQTLAARFSAYTAANNGGTITTIYSDRVEQVSRLQQTVLRYEELDFFLETPELLVLQGVRWTITLRADDITQEQAQQIYTAVCRHISADKRQFQGHFLSRRTVPLPLPDLSVDPPQELMRFSITSKQGFETGEAARLALTRLSLPLAAVSLVMTALFSNLYTPTGRYLLDFLLFYAGIFGGSLLFAAFLSHLLARREEKRRSRYFIDPAVPIVITTAGLTYEQYGQTTFLLPAQLRAQATTDGVMLQTPYGRLPLRWAEIPEPERLRQLLFGN